MIFLSKTAINVGIISKITYMLSMSSTLCSYYYMTQLYIIYYDIA